MIFCCDKGKVAFKGNGFSNQHCLKKLVILHVGLKAKNSATYQKANISKAVKSKLSLLYFFISLAKLNYKNYIGCFMLHHHYVSIKSKYFYVINVALIYHQAPFSSELVY